MTKWHLAIAVAIISVLVVVVTLARSEPRVGSSPRVITRVVSLAPSMTETMIALGLAHTLVGVSVHCENSVVAHVPKIGSFAEPNFEAIIAQRPDLVLGVPHVMAKPVLDKLAASGIEVFAHQPDSLRDIKFVNTSLARKFSVVDDGKRLNDQIDRSLILARQTFHRSFVADARRSVLIVVASSPFVVAGRATFASQIIEAVGLNNLATDRAAWPVWPLEKLLDKPPAFLILMGGDEALPSFQALISSLGLDLASKNISLLVPTKPIFISPSPAIIRDIEYLSELFATDS